MHGKFDKVYLKYPKYHPSKLKKASQLYRCAECGKLIKVGLQYWKYKGEYYHKECIEAGKYVLQSKFGYNYEKENA